jgi:hypothetical protein
MKDEILKESFVKLCSKIFVSQKGFEFPFDEIRHSDDFESIYKSRDYPLLEKKMTNLLNLINSDSSMIDKDIETELWYLV